MLGWKWLTWVGVVCLLVGSLAQLAQYLVTPLRPGTSTAAQVAQVAADRSAMQLALVLDMPLLLIVPAVLFIGAVAGLRSSRLAVTGTVVAFISLLVAVLLLAHDVLLYEAGGMADPVAATALVEAYDGNWFVVAMLMLYLIGQTLGFLLLASALWRARTVPRWAAVALAAFPVVQFVGVAGDVKAVGAAGYALAVVGFAACALALLRSTRMPAGATRPTAVAAAVAP